jgi:hypothetical protein
VNGGGWVAQRAEKSTISHPVNGAQGSEEAALGPQTPPPIMHKARPRDATYREARQSRVREIHTPPPGRLIRCSLQCTHGAPRGRRLGTAKG